MVLGYHISNHFQEPMQGGLETSVRTTLVQSADCGWSMAEFCEALNKLVLLDAPFEERAMRPVITILTRDAMVPEDMGFILEDEFDFNPQRENDDVEAAAIPVAPDEEEMEQKRDEDGERRDDRIGDMVVESVEEKKDELDKIVVPPFDPQVVVVNGIELTSESSLATLQAALAFYGKSTPGGKHRCFRKQWRCRRVTSESLGCNLWLNDLEMLRWRGIASLMFPMPLGASTVWPIVLVLTGMRGVICLRNEAFPR